MVERLALGTAQFGLRYGVANTAGQISETDAKSIIDRARSAGLDTIDTAVAYGDSEDRLGQIGVTSWKVVTKLPPVPAGRGDIAEWVQERTAGSVRRLGLTKLYGLLLHSPQQLTSDCGHDLYRGLMAVKKSGLAEKIGISVYHPEQIGDVLEKFDIDLVQAPFNVIDRRLETSGWLERLKRRGIEVHTRSAFLQGLLVMKRADRPAGFGRWKALWDTWDHWLSYSGLTPIQACVGFALAQSSIDRVVVGVDNVSHLNEIIAAANSGSDDPPVELISEDRDLIDPSRWN